MTRQKANVCEKNEWLKPWRLFLEYSMMQMERSLTCGDGYNRTGSFADHIPEIFINSISLLICLCGLVGNETMLWLLGFYIKRNPFNSYFLNLAIADSFFLICTSVFLVIYYAPLLQCQKSTGFKMKKNPFTVYILNLALTDFFVLLLAFLIILVNYYLQICLLLSSLNSSINPVIYFLVGSYRQRRFEASVKVAFRRVFAEETMCETGSQDLRDTAAENSV
ncbi:LOW QUALITY PROTEIN: uncharacterized protein ACNFOS_002962 [Eudromia elegans]